jgi:hypothetical protein
VTSHLCDRGSGACPPKVNYLPVPPGTTKPKPRPDHYRARAPEALAITLRTFNHYHLTRGE